MQVGHIEDVVVDSSARGKHFGKEYVYTSLTLFLRFYSISNPFGIRLVTQLRELGKSQGCYKIILDCSPEKSQFYLSCGFNPKERQMAWYIDTPTPGSSSTTPSTEQISE